MSKYLKRILNATSSAILLPVLYGTMFHLFIPSSYPVRWALVYLIPVVLLAIHWLFILIGKKRFSCESTGKLPQSLVFWLIPLASILSTMLLIMDGRGMAPEPLILIPMLMGFLLMVAGTYLPGMHLRQPLRFVGNVWLWCGGITVFISGLVHFYLYNILVAVLVLLPPIYAFLHKLSDLKGEK